MTVLFLLAIIVAAGPTPAELPKGAVEATIRGTTEPLEVELLLRNEAEEWNEIEHKLLPAGTRRVRFEGLEPGVYQILLQGRQPAERVGTKLVVGRGDTRQVTITVEPFVVSGRITFGGEGLPEGAIFLRHREFHWRGGLAVAAGGTFTATLWQRGEFTYAIRTPALPTSFTGSIGVDGKSKLAIDIPDGRVKGILRDAGGKPVEGVIVALTTATDAREDTVRVTTGADGTFEFSGIRHGRNTVRIFPPRHLEPEPIAFDLGENARQRELDVRLDAGREVALVVIDRHSDPAANARVFAVADTKLRARATTDEDGRATIKVPSDAPATLIVVAEDGPFTMLRVSREGVKGRLAVHLPPASSSLHIRASTTDGKAMPPFSLLMRYNGELVPVEVAEELTAVQGLQLMTGPDSEAHLRNIPSGSYEFWPYRSDAEVESIVAAGSAFVAPIQVNVRTGENKIAVRFARR